MPFEIKDKVALISGGASGIGLRYAKELLRNGLKGVVLADINESFGEQALKEIENEFGPNKAIFVKTDVTSKESYEGAFKKAIEKYKNLDILINNAGILNDSIWEKEVAININGVIHGILLGLEEYILKYKSSEGVIVNISSIVGINASPPVPIYTATKHAVIGMTMAFGSEFFYQQTKIKVLALCPGVTDTPLMRQVTGKTLGKRYEDLLEKVLPLAQYQEPELVAAAMVDIIQNAGSGTVWVAENTDKPYQYTIPPRETFATK